MCVVKNSLKKYTIKNWSGNLLFTLSSSDDSTAILRVPIWENEFKKKKDIQGRENRSDLWEKMGSSLTWADMFDQEKNGWKHKNLFH